MIDPQLLGRKVKKRYFYDRDRPHYDEDSVFIIRGGGAIGTNPDDPGEGPVVYFLLEDGDGIFIEQPAWEFKLIQEE